MGPLSAVQREGATCHGDPRPRPDERVPTPRRPREARAQTALAGLVAYDGTEPIGFISLGPRLDFSRIANSKATPPVDDVDAWVIPCITVRRGYRGRGAAIAMIQAAVDHAARHGAAAVEAYPRASGRVHDDLAFIGTKSMFEKAGFRQIRGVLPGLPKGWAPRVTMRAFASRGLKKGGGAPNRARRAASAPRRRSR